MKSIMISPLRTLVAAGATHSLPLMFIVILLALALLPTGLGFYGRNAAFAGLTASEPDKRTHTFS